MNEWGTTMYPNNVCVPNENKKKAAEKALAAIQEVLDNLENLNLELYMKEGVSDGEH